MAIIPLARRFLVWTSKESADPDLLTYFWGTSTALRWEDLLAKHRVVVLAEAGSGKSDELEEQARLAREAGKYAFHATVQSVGTKGFQGAITKEDAARLAEWKSGDQPAWFFLDSVDEAKSRDVRLSDALREVASAVHGGEQRAHIILSGRYSDWEFRRDLETLEQRIPMPPVDRPLQAVDPNQLIVRAIRREKPPEPPPPAETPLVVVMAALDKGQVEVFARGKGVAEVEEFSAALERANLWDLARRPLDLDWLVRYWLRHRTFGSLAEMLRLSLDERLREVDPQRARRDPLEGQRSMQALERISAALTFGRINDIKVPDSALALEDSIALDLNKVLPDWSGAEIVRLLSRAIFDPARFGHVRLHNDNQGVVRAFLTAAWMLRLRDANCPKSILHRLLFSDTYGVPVVKASMQQTAAWLSIWDSDVAREVIRRDPRLPMSAGDPASLSLSVREEALDRVLRQVTNDEAFAIPDRDTLRRFSGKDMAPAVRRQWAAHSGSAAAREVLLLMIWLGELNDCADLASQASFGVHPDKYTQVFSGRALMAVAVASKKRRYAEYIRDHAAAIPKVLVWDALDEMFPAQLTVDDLIVILKATDLTDRSGGFAWAYRAPKLVQRLTIGTEVEKLLDYLVGTDPETTDGIEDEPGDDDGGIVDLVEATANRLLDLSPPDAAPTSAVRAALAIGEERAYRRHRADAPNVIYARLHRTPERRRAAMWFAVAALRRDKKEKIADPWQLEIHGYPSGLQFEDLGWLLEDAGGRDHEDDRRLAINASMTLWRQNGSDRALLDRIQATAASNPALSAAVAEWMKPPPPSEQERQFRIRMRRLERRNALEATQVDKSWADFADSLRSDPNQLRRIAPPNQDGVDGRLYDIWRLISAVGTNQTRYAVEDLSPLIPMLGVAVVDAVRDAFVEFWRKWKPRLHSERARDEQNVINTLDCMGIVGVTLESVQKSGWAESLTAEDARLAAKYATLELNGFPRWLSALATSHPKVVADVLVAEMEPEFQDVDPDRYRHMLQKVADADDSIAQSVAKPVFQYLEKSSNWTAATLGPALEIVRRGFSDRAGLETLLAMRFRAATIPQQQAIYAASLFQVAPSVASEMLMEKLRVLERGAQSALVQGLLPRLVGERRSGNGALPSTEMSFDLLEKLVSIAFRTIRVEDDIRHTEAYTPSERDHAQNARDVLFNALADKPGLATFDALRRMMSVPDFPISKARLRALGTERAASDADSAPWQPADIYEFESDYATLPRTPLDLQRVAEGRIEDMQHDLVHSDFALGKVVALLPAEKDVQVWVANEFETRQRRSYSVERESHVVEEKEPDVRLRAKASEATLPIEVKVAESWTLKALEEALEGQLVGKYLRARNARHGILLLVHRESRPKGWETMGGKFLTFDEVVAHLKAKAYRIAAESPDGPQPTIAVLDVSRVVKKV